MRVKQNEPAGVSYPLLSGVNRRHNLGNVKNAAGTKTIESKGL